MLIIQSSGPEFGSPDSGKTVVLQLTGQPLWPRQWVQVQCETLSPRTRWRAAEEDSHPLASAHAHQHSAHVYHLCTNTTPTCVAHKRRESSTHILYSHFLSRFVWWVSKPLSAAEASSVWPLEIRVQGCDYPCKLRTIICPWAYRFCAPIFLSLFVCLLP